MKSEKKELDYLNRIERSSDCDRYLQAEMPGNRAKRCCKLVPCSRVDRVPLEQYG